MSAEKINGTPPPVEGRSSGAAPSPPDTVREVTHERVLGEISHELGNFFHKLYYWAEFLQETRAAPADGTAVQMLERTIRSLQDFLHTSLEFFHPVQLACVPMPVADVVSALLGPLRTELNGTPVSVTEDAAAGRTILVDPARLSQAWVIATRELLRGIGAGSSVRIATHATTWGGRPGFRVSVALQGADGAPAVLDSAMDGVEWAFAERIVSLHGGEIVRGAAQGEDALAIVLPFQS